MRTRGIYPIIAVLVLALGILASMGNGNASARFQTDATPEGTPVDNASPVADDATPDGIVTLVLWYQQNEEGDIFALSPIKLDGFTATQDTVDDDSEGGRIVFEEENNEGYPRIRIGEGDYFDAQPIYPDDPASVQRWFYYNDDPVLRPATMVMQIVGIKGQYGEWYGTATFISRGTDQGGILVIAINPPAE